MEDASDQGQYAAPKNQPADALEDALTEPQTTVSDGRRRGRRKVLRKKTIKDEEGYLGSAPQGDPSVTEKLTTILSPSHERGTCLGVLLRG